MRLPDGPITIIEGPDGSGKTTLARAIQDWSAEWGYRHQGPYSGDPFEQSMLTLLRTPGPYLLDRFHVGEQVYGPIFRQRDALGRAGRRMLERALLSRQAVLVLARPPYEDGFRVWADRRAAGKEMFNERYADIYHAFTVVRSHLPVVIHDFTRDDPVTTRFRIEARRPLANAGPGGGHWAPERVVLLVGEQINPRRRFRWDNPPFCARGGCNEWLAEQLEEAGVDERGLYWINALQPGGRETPARFLEALRPRHAVALGRVAERWCRTHLQELFTAVSHPQAHKRFHHHEPYELMEVLRAHA